MPLWFPRIGLTLTVSDALDQVNGTAEDRKRTIRTGNRLSDGDICLYRTSYVRALSNATRLRIADRCTLAATDHGQRHRPSIQDERMVQLQHLSVQHRQSDESDVYLPIAEAERHDPESRLCHYRGRLYGPRCIRCLQGDAAGISENHQHKTYDEIKILYRTGKIMKNKITLFY